MQHLANNLISVVIPVHNRPNLIKRTIESVVAQSYRPFSLIVVDNNSSDNTLEVVTALARKFSDDSLDITVLSEPKPGATFARNRGLRAVKTLWTMFFDSDDIMTPRHIERAMTMAATTPDAQIIGWDVDSISLSGSHKTLPFEPHSIAFNNLFHGSLSTLRYMARTELFNRVGGWNTNVTVWDDIELGARLLLQKPNIVKVSDTEKTVLVEAQEVSISGNSYASRIGNYQAALDSIARTLPENHKDWVQLKKVIIAATIVREGETCGKKLYADALLSTPTAWHRLLWRFAFAYTSRGGRGIARILKPLIC